MRILDSLVALYAPFRCLGCDIEGSLLLCASCSESIPTLPPRCYLCKATSFGYEVCRQCRKRTPLSRVVPVYSHAGLAKELLHVSKYERAASGLRQIADSMADRLVHTYDSTDSLIVVPVPTASSRVRTRGYDQSVLLARFISQALLCQLCPALSRLGQAHQVGSGRTARIRHVDGAFRVRNNDEIRGKHIVLVDDVCTTGATLEEAARMLKRHGAKTVDAVVYTQPD